MGYWHGCTSTLDSSITFEYELSALNGLDAGVVTFVPEEEPNKKYAVLAFKGSDEAADWLTNLDFFFEDTKPDKFGPDGMAVHGGYYDIIWSKRFGCDLVKKTLDLINRKGYEKTLYVVGYSAGGGFSNIVGPWFAERYEDLPVKVITWGSPRGGNDVYKDYANSLPNLNFWRFVYQQDPVPRLPLSDGIPILGGFNHAGHLFDISETDAKAYYFQTGGDGFEGVPDSWNYDYSFDIADDHTFLNYCNYFENDSSTPGFWPSEFEV